MAIVERLWILITLYLAFLSVLVSSSSLVFLPSSVSIMGLPSSSSFCQEANSPNGNATTHVNATASDNNNDNNKRSKEVTIISSTRKHSVTTAFGSTGKRIKLHPKDDEDNRNTSSSLLSSSLPPSVTPARATPTTPTSSASTFASTMTTATTCLSQSEMADLLWKEAAYKSTGPHVVPKRQQYLSWEAYFMATAALSAQRAIAWQDTAANSEEEDSDHPITAARQQQPPAAAAGCCVVDSRQRIVAVGHAAVLADGKTVVEAEVNAILNKCATHLHGARLYYYCAAGPAATATASPPQRRRQQRQRKIPSHESAKMIIQSGITEVVYFDDTASSGSEQQQQHHQEEESEQQDDEETRASRILLQAAGVKLRQFQASTATNNEEEPLLRVTLDFGREEDSPVQQHNNKNKATTPGKEDAKATRQDQVSSPSSSSPSSDVSDSLTTSASSSGRSPPDNTETRVLGHPQSELLSSSATHFVVADHDEDDAYYFMSMAFLTAQRSKDPNTQVGACIVDARKRIVGLGYNGFPAGCSDDCLPWARGEEGETPRLHTKYMYVCHAEVNAILNKCSADVFGATLYVAMFPCNECSKMIIQAGIRRVVYLRDPYRHTETFKASRILLAMAQVELVHYQHNYEKHPMPLILQL